MAIWQFTVSLIPRAWTELEGNGPELLYDDEGFYDTSAAWQMNQLGIDLVDLISQVLPPATSWGDGIKIWGDQTSNDIQIGYDGTIVESITARIDTRKDVSFICSEIVGLACFLDCLLFLPSAHTIITADIAALTEALYESRAACFSAAPRDFLEGLARIASDKD